MDEVVAPLLGRDEEVARLQARIDEVADGTTRVVVLRAPGGMGKSRLLDEVGALAEARGMLTAIGRAVPADAATPFGLLAAALRSLPREGIEALLDGAVSRLLAAHEVHAGALAAADDLADLARALGGLVVLLDDVQWADEASLTAVRRAVDRPWDAPLLLALAARPVPSTPALDGLVDPRSRIADVLDLAPLSPDRVDQLATARLGRPPADELRHLVAGMGGNPFLVLALVDAHAAAPVPLPTPSAVPVPVPVPAAGPGPGPDRAAALPARWLGPFVAGVLRDLSPDARAVVEACTLHDLSIPVAAHLLDRPEAAVRAAVDQALAAGLVRSGPSGLQPVHDLIREAVLDGIPAATVTSLHGALARVLAERGADPDVLAPHRIAAATAADPASVRAVRTMGVELLERRPALALLLLERAVALGDHDAGPHHLRALMLTGRLDEATAAGEALRAREDMAADGHVQAVLAQVAFLRGRLRESARGCADAAVLLPPGPDRALVRADQAVANLFAGQVTEAEDLAAEVRTGGEGTGAPATAQALGVQLMAASLRGDEATADRVLDELRTASRQMAADGVIIALPDLIEAMVRVWRHQVDAAGRALDRAQVRIGAAGLGWALPMLHAVRAELLLLRGQPEHAAVEASAGADLAATLGSPLGAALSLAQRSHAELWLGADPGPTLAAAGTTCGQADGFGVDVLLHATGLAQEAAGEHQQALASLGLLLDRVDELGLHLRTITVAPDVVRLAAVVGDEARGVAVARRLAGLARDGHPTAALPALRARVRIGPDPAEATARLRDRVRGVDAPLERARVLGDVAAGWRRVGDEVRARRAEQEAAAVLSSAGAVLPGSGAAVGVPGATPQRLSPAEARVVGLVGEGLSNAQVALRLGVSRRTVESHLHNIYRRLGIGSRVELALAAEDLLA